MTFYKFDNSTNRLFVRIGKDGYEYSDYQFERAFIPFMADDIEECTEEEFCRIKEIRDDIDRRNRNKTFN